MTAVIPAAPACTPWCQGHDKWATPRALDGWDEVDRTAVTKRCTAYFPAVDRLESGDVPLEVWVDRFVWIDDDHSLVMDAHAVHLGDWTAMTPDEADALIGTLRKAVAVARTTTGDPEIVAAHEAQKEVGQMVEQIRQAAYDRGYRHGSSIA